MVAACDDGNRRYVAEEMEAFARPYRRRVHVLVVVDAMLSPRSYCLPMRMCLPGDSKVLGLLPLFIWKCCAYVLVDSAH